MATMLGRLTLWLESVALDIFLLCHCIDGGNVLGRSTYD
jgi:hypothetical protein